MNILYITIGVAGLFLISCELEKVSNRYWKLTLEAALQEIFM